MAEIKLTGWKAAAALLLVGGFLSVRAISMGDMKDNESLAFKVRMQLLSEYLPYETQKINDLVAAGNEAAAIDLAAKVSKMELDIAEIKVSYPVHMLSTGGREGVVRVRFTLSDGSGVVKDGVNFYRVEHNPLGNTWYITRPTGEFDYYAKFLL